MRARKNILDQYVSKNGKLGRHLANTSPAKLVYNCTLFAAQALPQGKMKTLRKRSKNIEKHIKNIHLADSFLFNPHKWMLTNFDCSIYFVKNKKTLIKTFESIGRVCLFSTTPSVKFKALTMSSLEIEKSISLLGLCLDFDNLPHVRRFLF